MDDTRKLAYRFLALSFRKRMAISVDLGLVENGDEALLGAELFRKVFRRAREMGLLKELWQEVAVAHGVPGEKNPYYSEENNET